MDYVVTVTDFQMGKINRTQEEQVVLGGKGINVSVVLARLGVQNKALGFVAGFTGEEIAKQADRMGISHAFIRVPGGYSRINVKWKHADGTELNGRGPFIGSEEQALLYRQLDGLKRGDILVLAGSVPRGVAEDAYETIMERLAGRGIRFVVDAAGALLSHARKARPFLIKPNRDELGELFGVEIETVEQAAYYGKKLKHEGAGQVLVSLGEQGAVLVDEHKKIWHQPAIQGIPVNTVGAGDSMVAGFLAGWQRSGDPRQALALGTAAGSASAFSDGLADREQIQEIFRRMENAHDYNHIV